MSNSLFEDSKVLKKFLTTLALALVIAPLSGSAAPASNLTVAPTPAVKTRASFITPEVLAEIAAPIAANVKSAGPMSVENVKTVDDVRAWVYQTCPAVKIATIPGKASFYLPKNSAIAVGSETEAEWMSFVIAHELSHHYQWIKNNGDLAAWNEGLRSQEGLPPALEVQADHMAFEITGSLSDIANYAKEPATSIQRQEALRVLNFGKSVGC
jgi:hypothetical protein